MKASIAQPFPQSILDRIIGYWKWWPGEKAVRTAIQSAEGVSSPALAAQLEDLQPLFRKASGPEAGELWNTIWNIRTALAARPNGRRYLP